MKESQMAIPHPVMLGETSLVPIRQMASDEIDEDRVSAFVTVGFSLHTRILLSVKDFDERWYYILACARNHWSYTELGQHLHADDYRHVGARSSTAFARSWVNISAGCRVRSVVVLRRLTQRAQRAQRSVKAVGRLR